MAQHDSSAQTPHVVGEMDIREQTRTFDGFVRFMTWGFVLSALVLIFMALANA